MGLKTLKGFKCLIRELGVFLKILKNHVLELSSQQGSGQLWLSGEGNGQNLLVVAVLRCLEHLIFFFFCILHLLQDHVNCEPHLVSSHGGLDLGIPCLLFLRLCSL